MLAVGGVRIGQFYTFIYKGRDGVDLRRVVYVYEVSAITGFIKCYDFVRQDYRNFKLAKMRELKPFTGRTLKLDVLHFPKNFDYTHLTDAYAKEGLTGFYDSNNLNGLFVAAEVPKKPTITSANSGHICVKGTGISIDIFLPSGSTPYTQDGIVRKFGWQEVVNTLQKALS
jgi:hypothetical protein